MNIIMKTTTKILSATLLLATVALSTGCKERDLPDNGRSVVEFEKSPENAFDTWINQNFVTPYNVRFMYRMDDKEIDFARHLAPPSLEKSMKMAKVVQHAWIDAYNEVAGVDFMRDRLPRILMLIGSPGYNANGTILLGTAEGGLKVTLYQTNWLDETDPAMMNTYYFHTMHHEFTHILQQKHDWPRKEYSAISQGDYAATSWQDRRAKEAALLGFVSPYAGSQPVEDITEVTAYYLTYTDEEWDNLLNNLAVTEDQNGKKNTEGRDKILRKIELMKGYMKDKWNIDMDELRAVVQRRTAEVAHIQLIEESWKPLLQKPTVPTTAARQAAMRSAVWEALMSNPDFRNVPAQHDHSDRCQMITQFMQDPAKVNLPELNPTIQ